MSPSTTIPLSTRSLNTTTSPTKPTTSDKTPTTTDADADDKPTKTMEYHRQVLQSKLAGDGAKHEYISPSDNILSPCTKKLAVYKGRQFGKAKPQSLFAKQVGSRNMGAGAGAGAGEGEVREEEGEGEGF